jgi:hypothetical protein
MQTGIGTDYVNVNGQLTHPDLLSKSQIYFDEEIGFEKWTEIHWAEVPCLYLPSSLNEDERDRETVIDVWTVGLSTLEDPIYLVTMLGGTTDYDSIIIETTIGFPFPEVVGTNVIIPEGQGEIYLSKVADDFNNLDHYARTMAQLQDAVESLEETKGTTEEDVVLSEHLLDLYYPEDARTIDD